MGLDQVIWVHTGLGECMPGAPVCSDQPSNLEGLGSFCARSSPSARMHWLWAGFLKPSICLKLVLRLLQRILNYTPPDHQYSALGLLNSNLLDSDSSRSVTGAVLGAGGTEQMRHGSCLYPCEPVLHLTPHSNPRTYIWIAFIKGWGPVLLPQNK